MQFGKFHGIALMLLGVVVLAIQLSFVALAKNERPATEVTAQMKEHRINLWPSVLGAVFLVAGFGVFITARRKDEPSPKNAVK